MTDEADKLYVTQKQIVQRMGVGIHAGNKEVQKMRQHPKFPPRSVGGKYYWPIVADFIDFWNRRSVAAPGTPAGQEDQNGQTANRGRPRPSLEAAKEWLGSRVGGSAGHSQEGLQAVDTSDRNFYR